MFLKRSTGKVVLVADIEDASVGVSIVRPTKHGPVEILAGERMRLPLEDRVKEQSGVAMSQMLATCAEKVLKTYMGDIEKHTPKPPHEIYAIVRAPWTRYRTAKAEEKFEKPRAVTKEIIASLAKKALTEPSRLDRDSILESGVMHVFLNGYPTANPLGKIAARVGVVSYESDTQGQLKQAIEATLGKLLPGRSIVMKSGMSAVMTVLNEHIPDIHRFVIIDVGGSVTSCAVVLKESVTQSATVPEGLSTVLKRVAAGGLPEETLAQLRMLSTDSCSTDACKALKESLARAELDMTKVFGETFASLAAKRRLPNAAILMAPTELTPWLQGFFARIDFSQFTATMQPFTVEILSADLLLDVSTTSLNVPADTGLSIAAGYVNILEQN